MVLPDSAAHYQTQIALIVGTNWKESIPGAECSCLPAQKLAAVPPLTSSHTGAKKPLCRRPLNSALNHTLGGLLSEEATEQTWHRGKKNHPPTAFSRERPRGKSTMKMDGNSAEQLMHSLVWLRQHLREPLLLLPPSPFCGLALIELQHFALSPWDSIYRQWHVWLNTKCHFLGNVRPHTAWRGWVIHRSSAESSVLNEVKDYVPVADPLPGTAGKCQSQRSDHLQFKELLTKALSLVRTEADLQPCRDPALIPS